jgi:GNAT superfamily N-acetyltransferase
MADPVPAPEPTAPAPVPAAGGLVPVKDPYGRLGHIPAAQVAAAQAQGYQPIDEREIADATRSPLARAADAAAAWQQGGITGATAGLALPIQKKIAALVGDLSGIGAEEGEKRFVQGRAGTLERHPTIAGAGEIGGMIGGTVATGAIGKALSGVGALARAGNMATKLTPLGAIEGAGGAAEALAGRATAGLASTGALGRAAASATKFGARGATEMALFDAMKEVGEESLGDAPLNGEKIYAAAAEGAKGGLLFGAALGGTGSLLKTAGTEAIREGREAVSGLRNIAQSVAAENAPKFESLANEQRWRALNPRKAFSDRVERIPGGVQGMGGTLKEYGILPSDLKEAATTTAGEIDSTATKLDGAVTSVGEKIGELQQSAPGKLTWGDIDDAIEKVIAPERKKADFESIVNSLDRYRTSLADKLVPEEAAAMRGVGDELNPLEANAMGANYKAMREAPITIQDAIFQRKALDELVYRESKSLDPNLRVSLMRDVRAKLEDLIEKSIDDGAKAAGNAEVAAKYKKLKLDYQRLTLAKDAAEDASSRALSNRAISPTDYYSGGVGASIGGTLGSVLGPPGHFLGSIAGGAAGAAINRIGRTRGNAIAASVLDRLAAFGRGGLSADLTRGGEAASALSKEAALADGVAAAGPKAGETLPAPGASPQIPSKPPLTFQKEFTEQTLRDLGIAEHSHEDALKLMMKQVFKDKIPDAEGWRNMWRVPEGYSIKFTSMRARSDLHVEADILDSAGEKVGYLERSFKPRGGRLVVHHDLLELEPRAQKKGIGSAISDSALESYNQLGVKQIRLNAGLEAGAYVWAKKGYEFASKEEREDMARRFEAHVRELADHHAGAAAYSAAQTPKGIAEFTLGGKPVGKDFLLRSDQGGMWEGKMDVPKAYAAMLDKAAELERAKQAIKIVDEKVKSAAKGLVEGHAVSKAKEFDSAARIDVGGGNGAYRSAPAEKSAGPIALKKRFDTAVKKIEGLTNSPERIVEQMARPIGDHMPKTSEALSATALRAVMYMTNQRPPTMAQYTFGAPLPTRVADNDMLAYLEKFEAASNPLATIKTFEHGKITPNQAQAIKFVTPDLFAQLQRDVIMYVADKQADGNPVPFNTRQRLGLILGVQTDPSQAAAMAAHLQSNLAPPAGGKGGIQGLGPKMSPGKPINLPASLTGGTKYGKTMMGVMK